MGGVRRFFLLGVPALAVALTGCMKGGPEAGAEPPTEATAAATRPSAVAMVERDVEAPEVFSVSDEGLWDGRPSLGGVWVAYPEVGSPERVIIRNSTNGQTVIGALFKREREHPGPKLQVSSDAAAALGLLAGKPTMLDVTALRRTEPEKDSRTAATATAPAEPDAALKPVDEPAPEMAAAALAGDSSTEEVAATVGAESEATNAKPRKWRLRNPFRRKAPVAAGTAVSAAALAAEEIPAETLAVAPAATAPADVTSRLDKPYVQIGIFSKEQNALGTAEALRRNGLAPEVYAQESRDKKFWRVVVGPAATSAERSTLLSRARKLGFADAYAVTN